MCHTTQADTLALYTVESNEQNQKTSTITQEPSATFVITCKEPWSALMYVVNGEFTCTLVHRCAQIWKWTAVAGSEQS